MAHRGMLEHAGPSFLASRKNGASCAERPGPGRASIPEAPKSPGLTGSSGRGPRVPLLVVAVGACPEGSRWPVTHLSDGDKAPGPGRPGLSAPTPRNLETGRAWGLGVFSTCCWLWGEAQRGACRGGRRKGCGQQGPVPPPPPPMGSRPPREQAEACGPLPDACSLLRARQAQTQMLYLLPLPHPSSIRPAALTSTGLSPSPPRTGLHPREQRSRGNSHRHTHNLLFLDEFQPAQSPRRRQGSHLGLCKHLPALQLAHLDQGGRNAHVRTGGSSNPVAVGCESGEAGVRHAHRWLTHAHPGRRQ